MMLFFFCILHSVFYILQKLEFGMSTLKINGDERDFPEGLPATLTALLEELDVNAATVVAEVDGQIVPREQFNETSLSDGQQIELVRFVGGG